VFISYAKNFEDVVLWRALGEIERGTYVDVGATDPVHDSATFALYRQGWRGALVTPEPSFVEALGERRPGDVVVAAAAEPAGPVAPLDNLLVEAGFDGRTIHVCTIDVAGRESDALAGFDLRRWHPWVLVVAATESDRPEPSHHAWEPRVLESGYACFLFDGINRFYVEERQAASLGSVLSYPASAFDQPFARAEDVERREALDRATAQVDWLETTNNDLQRQLATIEDTLSWRVTRPLRSARKLQLTRSPRARSAGPGHPESGTDELRTALTARLATAASVIDPDLEFDHDGVAAALSAFGDALRRSHMADPAKAWLALVTVDGSYPGEDAVQEITRRLRMDGARAVTDELSVGFRRAVARGSASTAAFRVARGAVLVDVSDTVATERWTGIQRVVRESARRWVAASPPPMLVAFDKRHGFVRTLAPHEAAVVGTPDGASTEPVVEGPSGRGSGPKEVLIPLECRLVLPELFVGSQRCRAYRALATSEMLDSISMIAYDLVPLIASETAADGMSQGFVDYLSVVKHVHRVSAISRSTADGYAAFSAMNAAQGIPLSRVEAHLLPTEAPQLSREDIVAAQTRLGVGTLPLVLVVGSHEPRKNHLRVLEAAERRWTAGSRFELLFVGGSSWKSEGFEELAGRLESLGRPVRIVRSASEEDLWAAYRLARFTVFPSLLEGFGLPVAESLASGTPAITSRHGSTAEIAEDGGCLLVDPYDVTAIAVAMERLLVDDMILERLRSEARARRTSTWAEYTDAVWGFLVEGNPA
jgi:hypothetical protein